MTKDLNGLLMPGKPSQTAIKLGYSSADESRGIVPSFAYAGDTVEAVVLASMRQGHGTKNMGGNDALNVDRTTPNPQDTKSNYVLAKLLLKPDHNQKFKVTLEDLDREVDNAALIYPKVDSPLGMFSYLCSQARKATMPPCPTLISPTIS